jgi:hypothetical protein
LKTDGTLWWWGRSDQDWHKEWPGLRAVAPERLGTDSDWAELFASGVLYFRKTNGEVWDHISRWDHYEGQKLVLNESNTLGRVPQMEGHKWKSILQIFPDYTGGFRAGLTEDGRFLEIAKELPNLNYPKQWASFDHDLQIGTETKWVKAICLQGRVFSLKDDGTLWEWNFKTAPHVNPHGFLVEQFSEYSDWVDISGGLGGFTALAADGSLWLWQLEPKWYDRSGPMHPLLLQSRKPQYLGNIFSATH